ncbi:transcriptional regulator [Nocardia terpenica]|uniref:winged helix-turn-helix transcriptional regulator n=1 Tax=Nocardia terpenica TaxID=455432 RepID=UPI0018932E5A|nr:helix-turn-helix domain-containing protein [Nocardia terpenica]MBF6062316.1 transcriptional regulator [Nocardia terpenica]MBF6104404.1 transcriptional regulator [Nocardia terpenica]MBF6109740.1 transcriptional regulator [Nocardia terpenica]MBF6120046.1 transcriptional regulator [Nocardia terpenica]MBF6152457.1 transcriptional regulator [Nocardia terpenica]
MRSYGQYCGLARSLEVVGDRWNLLIVRQLLIAPARYRDLIDGLPGIATNLLADRLRDLEAAGVVERRLTGAGSVVEYALTPWGAELRQPIESLIRWSTPLMLRGPDGDSFRPEWLALAVPALLDARVKVRASATVGLEIGDPPFQLRATRSGFEVGPHDGRKLDATVRADPAYILGLAAGALTLSGARALGLVEIDGDESVVRTVFAA